MKNNFNFLQHFKALSLVLMAVMVAVGVNAQTFTNTTPVAIPDNNPAGASSVIAVAGASDLLQCVTINITHTWDSDLGIFLIGPNNVTLELSTGNGGSGDNYTNTSFTRVATTNITAGTAPFTGTFLPEFPLSTFDGQTNGNWTLFVVDGFNGDAGTINSWSLTFAPTCTISGTPLPAVTVNAPVGGCITGAGSTMTAPSVTGGCTTLEYYIDGSSVIAGTVTAGASFTLPAGISIGQHSIRFAIPCQGSATQSFTVLDQNVPPSCPITFNYTGAVVTIADNTCAGPTGNQANAPITISGLGAGYLPTSVTVNVLHAWDSDVDMYLVAPDGTVLELSTDNGGSGDNYTNTTFTIPGTGINSITTGAAPFTGTFTPEGPGGFSVFDNAALNANANGAWTLRICDDEAGFSGTIQNWRITFAPPCDFAVASLPNINRNSAAGACQSAPFTVTAPNTVGVCGGTVMTYSIDGAAAVTTSAGATVNIPALAPGTHTVTFALDNGSTLVQTIVVTDNVDPVFTNCPASPVVINLGVSDCSAVYNYAIPTATDNCTGIVVPSTGGFAGAYAPANWTATATGGLQPAVVTTGAPASILLQGGTSGQVNLCYTVTAPGTISFDWFYDTNETNSQWDDFGYTKNGGAFVQLSTDGLTGAAADHSGSASIAVVAGDVFCFRLIYDGSITTNTTISNFSGPVAGVTTVTQTAGAPSGTALGFANSPYTYTFVATDPFGRTAQCTYQVEVNATGAGALTALACNDHVQISLDENCAHTIGADEILEGGPYRCYDLYTVEVDRIPAFGNGPWAPAVLGAADIDQTFGVKVTDPLTGNSCWGLITVEDKLKPELTCTDATLLCGMSLSPTAAPVTSPLNLRFPATVAPGATVTDLTTVEFPIQVGVGNVITDVNLFANFSGDVYFYNLVLELESPAGTVVTLWNQIGVGFFGATGTVNATFDDEGVATNSTAVLASGANVNLNALLGADLLSAFDGENPQGTWIVRISDVDGGGEVTNLLGFAIELQANGTFASGLPNGLTPAQVTPLAAPANSFRVAAGLVDACSPVTLTYVDTTVDEDCSTGLSSTVTRKWTATDASGNVETCTQTIEVIRPALSDVVLPADYTVACGSPVNPPKPTVFGVTLSPDLCNIAAGYNDLTIDICDGTSKTLRTWQIVDWCTLETIEHKQLIKVTDEVGPAFACPANMTVSTDANACCAVVNLPDVVVTDNCSRVDTAFGMVATFDPTGQPLEMFAVAGLLNGSASSPWNPDTNVVYGNTQCLPIGTHTVSYTAVDACGKSSTCSFFLTVRDYVAPTAICDEFTVISIGLDDPYDCYVPNAQPGDCTYGGVAWLHAATLDDGSYDNCGNIKFAVRRDPATANQCVLELNSTNGIDANGSDPEGPNQNCNDPFLDPRTESEAGMGGWVDLSTGFYGDSLKFYCCEVGTTQTVILSVYQMNEDGTDYARQANGQPLVNECMVQVQIQEKIKPVCVAPAAVTVSCENFDPTLWPYGNAVPSDNCCLDESKVYQGQCGLTHSVSYANFDTVCNRGTIRRTWTVYDCHNLTSTCQQVITVTPNQNYYVSFPKDEVVTSCTPGNDYGTPQFYGEDCELLAVSHVDELFTVVPDACYKIERTWTVINWCNYNSNTGCTVVPNPDGETHGRVVVSAPGNGISGWAPSSMTVTAGNYTGTFNYGLANGGGNHAGFGGWSANANCYKYKQIIKIIDNAAPTVVSTTVADTCDYTTNDAAYWNHMSWWDSAIESHDLCEGAVNLSLTATDACAGENVKIRYQLFLDLDHDGVMETVVPGSVQAPTLYGAVRYNNYQNQNFGGGEVRPFVQSPLVANNFGFGLQTSVSGDNLVATVRYVNTANVVQNPAVQLPYGTHKIKWIIEDGCGNEKVHETVFTVEDCKKPTVVCLNGVSVNLMNGPMNTVTLWANDVYEYANDNCTPEDLLKITVVRADADNGSLPTGTSVDFSCADLLPGLTFGTVVVNVYAEDAAGNFDFCAMAVQVQDNMNVCGNGTNASVAGALANEAVQGVEDATVELYSVANGIPLTNQVLSNVNGSYMFSNALPLAANATVTPVMDADPLNGVNTWDLVLISRHILGLEPLNTPYKLISADANKSGTVTTFDIVELRKLILGTYQALPNNSSWRFVSKSQVFTDNANPFADVIQENLSIANIQSSINNGDFVGAKIGDVDGTATPNQLVSADDRTAGTLLFDVEDRMVNAGEEVTVQFKAAEKVAGYQFTIALNGLETMDIVPGVNMSMDNFGIFANELTTSADGTDGVFSVTFKATKSGRVSEMLSVSSRITKAIAFNGENKLDVAFRFNNGGASTIAGVGFELYQNAPNPFVHKTVVGFHLPEATRATLSVYDEAGRLLYTTTGNFAKGYNAVQLDRSSLNANGSLYYKLETAANSATKQMIQSK